MNWDDLNIYQKAELMKLYVTNGITNLDTIKAHYNQNGTDDVEKRWYQGYGAWRRKMSEHKGIDIKHDDTYNYRQFYKDNTDAAWNMLNEAPDAHFTDLYKYPNHPTFSNQSMYSQQWQKDHAIKDWYKAPMGGDWGTDEEGNNVFRHSYFTAATPEKIKITAEYLKQNNPNVRAIFEPNVNTFQLPTIKVTGTTGVSPIEIARINNAVYMPKPIQAEIDKVKEYWNNQKDVNEGQFPNLEKQTYDIFNNNIWYLENANKEGYDASTGNWIAHKSPEGGKETIGGGIKFNEANKKWEKLYRKQGYLTDAQIQEAMQENTKRAYDVSKKVYEDVYGKGEWNKVSPHLRALLMDISYNTGNVDTFKNLLKGVHDNDLKAVIKEHHRKWTDDKGIERPLTRRNDYFDSVLTNTPNVFNYQQGGVLNNIKDSVNELYGTEVAPTKPSDISESEYLKYLNDLSGRYYKAIKNPIKPYTVKLYTFPIGSKQYPFTGHSMLHLYHGNDFVSGINKSSKSGDYNLFNKNCADLTGLALGFDTKGLTTPRAIKNQVISNFNTRDVSTPNVNIQEFSVSPQQAQRIKNAHDYQNFIDKGTIDSTIDFNTFLKLNSFQAGGSLGHITPYGQWQYPHQITTIPSNNITMKGVDYPVIGVSNTGDTKYMLPNMDYLFDGQYVTEYPIKTK